MLTPTNLRIDLENNLDIKDLRYLTPLEQARHEWMPLAAR